MDGMPEPSDDQSGQVVYGPFCPMPVARAAMVHWWDELTFIHWRFDPEAVQRLLPAGLTVETFDGSAWVGLVPFFLRVGVPRVPSVPWLSRFPETNVRTYARSADGTSGVWFFSLDAARLGAVVVARSTYRLPYFWSKMSIERSASTIRYRTERRVPRPRATSVVGVEIGERYQPQELSELDHFLTARWALFSAPRSGLHHARASHDPWPLHRAEIVTLDDTLVTAAGLPTPSGDPLVHYAPSVKVRIGWPRRSRRRDVAEPADIFARRRPGGPSAMLTSRRPAMDYDEECRWRTIASRRARCWWLRRRRLQRSA